MAGQMSIAFIFPTAHDFMRRNTDSEITLALLVFGFFVIMAILNKAAEWDRINPTQLEMIRMREELFLNVSQEEKIAGLKRDFYQELTQAYQASYTSKDELCAIINKIITEHNNQVALALNAEQRKKWQSFIACP